MVQPLQAGNTKILAQYKRPWESTVVRLLVSIEDPAEIGIFGLTANSRSATEIDRRIK